MIALSPSRMWSPLRLESPSFRALLLRPRVLNSLVSAVLSPSKCVPPSMVFTLFTNPMRLSEKTWEHHWRATWTWTSSTCRISLLIHSKWLPTVTTKSILLGWVGWKGKFSMEADRRIIHFWQRLFPLLLPKANVNETLLNTSTVVPDLSLSHTVALCVPRIEKIKFSILISLTPWGKSCRWAKLDEVRMSTIIYAKHLSLIRSPIPLWICRMVCGSPLCLGCAIPQTLQCPLRSDSLSTHSPGPPWSALL